MPKAANPVMGEDEFDPVALTPANTIKSTTHKQIAAILEKIKACINDNDNFKSKDV